jgi:hypothetical protein
VLLRYTAVGFNPDFTLFVPKRKNDFFRILVSRKLFEPEQGPNNRFGYLPPISVPGEI